MARTSTQTPEQAAATSPAGSPDAGGQPAATLGTTLYGIPNCDTVKRARAWLAERGVAHAFHDFKKAGVPPAGLDQWLAAAGWEVLLNRKGTMWRKLDDATRAAVVDAASARALMLAQPSVVKRPVVVWADGRITVGFDPEVFAQRAG